ncbi:hypothetical protein DIS24_g10397 [Lasiodiplodia hormozganensis]|uniref:Uncharacterized protein n=1 Tax=Lasiodiplodia hormozganensis TaxID=869390 RepID=A0AA39XQJ0_9PEZI|nr:hypothetical protein DIS24_g10397 [Lasiodiplodia hormozganensis]
MVLGVYPETDIIAPEVYCEICSYFMTRIGRSPKSDEITGSLPLICLKYSNAHGALQWTETIANALQKRFDDNIVLQIFLSALYYTIDDVSTDTPTTSLSDALVWACRSLVKVVRIPGELVDTPRSGAPEVLGFEYLQDVLKEQLDSLRKKSNPLLNYPLDGFVSLIRAALDLPSVCQTEMIKDAVWLRLLFTLMEHHFELQAKEGEKVARETLNTLLIEKPSGYSQAGQTSSATEDGADESPDELTPMGGGGSQTANGDPELVIDTKKTSVTLETLQQTHLFPPDILEQYQRLASVFPEKEEWCGRAIAVFLHVLYKESLGSRNATNLFGELKIQRRLRMIYWARENVDQLTAADMISMIYRK